MFHKLEHLMGLRDFPVIMTHADSAPGSVQKRFPCVTRVSRPLDATDEEARGAGRLGPAHSV